MLIMKTGRKIKKQIHELWIRLLSKSPYLPARSLLHSQDVFAELLLLVELDEIQMCYVAKIANKEKKESYDAVHALAEALNKNVVDLHDPQVQTNALLGKILLFVIYLIYCMTMFKLFKYLWHFTM